MYYIANHYSANSHYWKPHYSRTYCNSLLPPLLLHISISWKKCLIKLWVIKSKWGGTKMSTNFLCVSGFYFLQFASQPFFSTRCRKTRVLNFLFSFTRVIELETFYEFKMMKFFSPYEITHFPLEKASKTSLYKKLA